MKKLSILELVDIFKVLGDETRMKIIAMLDDAAEYNVGTIAEFVGLTDATISHHLKRLHTVGLINLRTDGNQRFYRLNKPMLKRISQQMLEVEQVKPIEKEDLSWIDALPLSDYDRKIIKHYTENGHLKQLPMQSKKLQAILHWILLEFEEGRQYTEHEVNRIMLRYHEDYAGLRRDLIGFGYLRRERGGGRYWLTPADEA